jgi:hypothetical protein
VKRSVKDDDARRVRRRIGGRLSAFGSGFLRTLAHAVAPPQKTILKPFG